MYFVQIKNKKRLIAVISVLLAAVMLVSVTLAMYTNMAYQRSVVRNRNGSGVCFYSDMLYLTANQVETYGQRFSLQDSSENEFDIVFHIYNYDTDKPNIINENDVVYDITFTLLDDGWCRIGQKELSGKGESCTIRNEKFQALKAGQHTYTITCSKEKIDTTMIQVVAQPQEAYLAGVQNQKLSAVLVPIASQSSEQVSMLTAKFVDYGRFEPSAFAAWPYLLSITSDHETVKLRWNKETLQIDPFFDEGNSGEKIIAMSMKDGTNSMLIPFYTKHQDRLSWEELDGIVSAEIITDENERKETA